MGTHARAAVTRQKLLDTAVRLFSAKGYDETTPQDIATEADLTTGAFYYHFRSKGDLAAAILDEGWPSIVGLLDSATPASGLERVIDAILSSAQVINSDKLHWVGFQLGMAVGHRSDEERRAFRERIGILSSLTIKALRDSEIRDGVTREQAAELLFIALLGAQLMSDALEETGHDFFNRLAVAWKSALRTIVPSESLPRFERALEEILDRHTGATGSVLSKSA